MSSSSSYDEVLDDGHYIPLVVLGSLSSCLSILGSSCIIYMASRQLDKVMHRLLFSLSIADLLSSTANLFMPFVIPSYLGLPGAIGNHGSCSAFGFLLMTGAMVGCCYNAYLSMYYLLVVRSNWKEHDFTTRREIGAHAFCILVPLSINIVAVVTQSINPSPLVNNTCVYATSPWTCNENEELDCDRSSKEEALLVAVLGGTFLLFFTFMGFGGTFWVWWTVRTTIRRSSAYRFGGQGEGADPVTEERLRQVCTQAICYSLVYFNTFFWPWLGGLLSNSNVNTTFEIQQNKTEPGYYAFQIFFWSLYPLQGFLNCLVYSRQKVLRWKKMEPERSLLWIYRQVLRNQPMPSQSSYTTAAGLDASRRHNNQRTKTEQQQPGEDSTDISKHEQKPAETTSQRQSNTVTEEEEEDEGSDR